MTLKNFFKKKYNKNRNMENANKLTTQKKNPMPNQEILGSVPINNQTPTEETPIKKVSTKKFYIIIGVTVLVMLLVLIGIFIYNSKISQQTKEIKNQTGNNNLTPTISTNQQPYKAKNWLLKSQTKLGVETVLTLPDIENQIVKWGDLLIYGSGDYSSDVQVNSLNLKTGEKKTIYDQASRNDFESGRNNRYVSDMQVLNNTLFFSIGGYMTSGATFWMTLPPTGQPQKLTGGANGKIEYWKDRYWLINGEGDACWGSTSYSLIDLTTKKVTEIATSTMGCFEGEEYVDIDKRNMMIMAFHTAGSGEGGDSGNGIYQYVIVIPLNNPSAKEGVIAKQDMPAGITSITYLADTDQLLLIGKEKYLFDFLSKVITKTNMAVPTSKPSTSTQDKTFKDKVKELSLPSGYEFVLE